MTIHYQLALLSPYTHEYQVILSLPNDPVTGTCLTLPAWIPGSYRIRDFAKHLSGVTACDDQAAPLTLDKTDKQTWRLAPSQGQVQITYQVYAWDLSVRTAYFDQTRAYFNGAGLFMRVLDQADQPHQLRIPTPEFAESAHWCVATSMPAREVDGRGFGLYQVENYAAFIDHPFEISNHRTIEFTVDDIPHRMAFTDADEVDFARIQEDVAPICAEHAAMFGELPIQQYLFMTLATADGYGGLEHCDSTSLICRRDDLPYAGLKRQNKAYDQFLALCSHEYFHLWHVKRIQPDAIQSSQLDKEAHTSLLWFFEGVTSYYDELALPRSGRITVESYLGMLAESITRLMRSPGRARQSVAESSFDAWTKFYQQDENAPNAIVSYYVKGALVAFGLDHLLRTHSQDKLSLDDLMRHLWQKYGRTGSGLPERQVEKEVAWLLQTSVEPFFSHYVYGVTELPLAEWFADFAIGYQLRPAQSTQDMGGYLSLRALARPEIISLGAKTQEQEGLVQITQVLHGGAAQLAGLAPGDLLVAIDGERCTPNRLTALLNRKSPGDSLKLTVFRRDLMMTLILQAMPMRADTCELWLLDDSEADPAALSRRESWLRSSTHDHPITIG